MVFLIDAAAKWHVNQATVPFGFSIFVDYYQNSACLLFVAAVVCMIFDVAFASRRLVSFEFDRSTDRPTDRPTEQGTIYRRAANYDKTYRHILKHAST